MKKVMLPLDETPVYLYVNELPNRALRYSRTADDELYMNELGK